MDTDQEQAMATDIATEIKPNGTEPDDAGPERSEAETRDSSQLFEFSDYVHVGPGADKCGDGENGKCNNPLHFHAWIRLPNPFQQSAIREKANAAKARRMRLLRDPDSDARIIIDEGVAELVRAEDREGIIEELVSKDFLNDHLKAMQEVVRDEELGFTHIDDDRERLRAIERMDPEDRPEEEYEELSKHVAAYGDAVNNARSELQAPLRQSLEEKDLDALGELLTDQRVEADAQQAWNEAYDKWEWYTCTLKPRPADKGLPVERAFSHIDHMTAAAPEVHMALKLAYADLEAGAGRQVKGF